MVVVCSFFFFVLCFSPSTQGVTGRCFCAAVAHQGAINLGFKRSGEPEGGVSSLFHFSGKLDLCCSAVISPITDFLCFLFCLLGRQFLPEILWVFVPPVNSCHVLRIKKYPFMEKDQETKKH
ncbi:hypothetical protein AMECASPLE_039658 [Ameca splendens]|uniref:Secreted protein n=1 Tax=Ameca splendens TaxID=208324 RepID=A0ABV1A3X4_9TELE